MKRSEALNIISDFHDNRDMDFDQCYNGYKDMEKIIEEYPEYSSYVLDAVSFSSLKDVFCADLSPMAAQIFVKAARNSDDEEVKSKLSLLFDKNPSFALMCSSELLKEKPKFADDIFRRIMSHTELLNQNSIYRYATAAVAAINQGGCATEMLEEAMGDPQLGAGLYKYLGNIYKRCPETGDQIIRLLDDKKYLTQSNYGALYSNLETVILMNEPQKENTFYAENFGNTELAEKAVALFEKHITDEDNDASTLSAAYKAAGHIGQLIPEYKERMEALIRLGMQHTNNTKASLKTAYRALNDFENLCSRADIYRRGQKTEQSPHGMDKVDEVDNDKPCLLFFGGDGARTEKALNGYLGDVYRLLEDKGLEKDVNVYGIVYDFGDYMDVNYARSKMMEDYHRSIKMKRETPPDTANPKYIKEIFDKFFLPRISQNGERIDAQQAAQNLRKINIVAHCHGAYTALALEEMMQQRMKEIGYSKEERAYIQKQLLVVAQSPYCPLGESRSTFVSFASADDLEISHYNNFERALRSVHKEECIPFSYFSGRRGNLFLADTMGESVDQHNFWGFRYGDNMDKQGQALILMEQKVLVNGIKNSLEPEKGIPEVRDLATDDENSRQLFDKAVSNGEVLYNKIYAISMAVARYRAQHEK